MADNDPNLIKNRRAFYDYEILEKLEAGLVLEGTEIKSLRNHGGSLAESYVKVIKNEVWLIGANIAHYRFGNIHNHEERRDRKLLLHKREIERLKAKVQEKGLAIVPIRLYLKKGRAKLEIGVGRGKKNVDRRASIKEREDKRRIDRVMKEQ